MCPGFFQILVKMSRKRGHKWMTLLELMAPAAESRKPDPAAELIS